MCFPAAHGRTGSRAAMLQVKRHDTVLAPHRLKTQGIDDALIQPYGGHAIRQSLETYSRLALADVQQRYDDVIGNFPV